MAPSRSDSVISAGSTGSKPISRADAWIGASIVAVAFALRIAALDLRPAHFDEGVNGWWVDQITKLGSYHYNPGFYHGPLHFYLLFVAQTLFGRHIWALRLPVVLFSTGCVGLALAYRRYLPDRVCQIAAAAIAVSPGMVYFGRDAIHEAEQVFFLILAVWAGAGLFHKGTAESTPNGRTPPKCKSAQALGRLRPSAVYAWTLSAALAGLILTKETYAVHFIAFLLAFPALVVLERISSSDCSRWGAASWPANANNLGTAALFTGLIVFFYSGALLDWSSLGGLFQALMRWSTVGFATEDHQKHYAYWLEILWSYEWAALAGIAATLCLVLARSDRFVRYLGIMGAGALAGYTLIPYKTPWCVLSIAWPFYFVLGYVCTKYKSTMASRSAACVIALLFAQSILTTFELNFRNFANESEPEKRHFPSTSAAHFLRSKFSPNEETLDATYVYVQTTKEIARLLRPLRWLTLRDAANYHIPGHVLIHSGESEPLPWLLGDFTAIDFLDDGHPPQQMDAEFLLVDDAIVSDTEERLNETYFKESFLLRGQSNLFVTLYLRASTFSAFFPNRTPEFTPAKTGAQ